MIRIVSKFPGLLVSYGISKFLGLLINPGKGYRSTNRF